MRAAVALALLVAAAPALGAWQLELRPRTLVAGSLASCELAVTNMGLEPAPDAALELDGGGLALDLARASLGTLGPGQSASVRLRAYPPPGLSGVVVMAATLSDGSGRSERQSVPVSVRPQPASPLALVGVSPTRVAPGSVAELDVRVRAARDVADASVSLGPSADYAVLNATTVAMGSLPAGGEAVARFAVYVGPGARGLLRLPLILGGGVDSSVHEPVLVAAPRAQAALAGLRVEGGRLSGEVANTGDADLRSVTVSVGEGCLSPARPVAFLGALPARSASPFSVELGQARACAPGELVSVAAAFGDGLGWEGQATGSALAQAQAPALPSLLPLLALVVALSLLVVARYVRGLRRVQRALAAERERLAELEGAQMPRRGG